MVSHANIAPVNDTDLVEKGNSVHDVQCYPAAFTVPSILARRWTCEGLLQGTALQSHAEETRTETRALVFMSDALICSENSRWAC